MLTGEAALRNRTGVEKCFGEVWGCGLVVGFVLCLWFLV